jgi:uncharacterized protein
MKMMLKQIAVVLIGLAFIGCGSDHTDESKKDSIPVVKTPIDSTGIDTALIRKLGADDYGMKNYVLALLKVGPNRNQDSATAEQLQKAHLDNIARMADEGKLVVAGPFTDDTELKGIYIFNVATVEEAEALTNTDPAIKAGRLVMELHPWYGSAAMMEINSIHKKLQKEGF